MTSHQEEHHEDHHEVQEDHEHHQEEQEIRVDFQTCPEFWLKLVVVVKNGKIKVVDKKGRCPMDIELMKQMGSGKYGRLLHSNENIMVSVNREYDSDDDDDEEEKTSSSASTVKPQKRKKTTY